MTSHPVSSPSTTGGLSLGGLCRYFLRLGATGFGGPVALVGYMQRDLVEERGWYTLQEYRDGLAIAQMAPGPLAAQLATWLAFARFGVRGATLATLIFVAPAFLIVVALAAVYVAAGGAPWIASVFYGVAPAAIAIIAYSAWRLVAATIGRDLLLLGIAFGLFALTLWSGSELVLAFLAAGLIVAVARIGVRQSVNAVARRIRGGALAMVAEVQAQTHVLLIQAAPQTQLLWDLFVYFLIAGTFVFGSGLAIVPFLHQGLVVETGWLTNQEFLDSVAVGLITPGPVVITAAFAGYLIAGFAGATVGALGVFLPAYLLVVIPGKWILRHKDQPAVSAFIVGVSAAATGAIAASVVILGRGAIVDPATELIAVTALVTLVAIRRWKPRRLVRAAEPMIVVVAGVLGLALRGV
jgi:chromate transporter